MMNLTLVSVSCPEVKDNGPIYIHCIYPDQVRDGLANLTVSRDFLLSIAALLSE
jgi:hypothetical protein